MTVALYRRYRPDTFDQVVGQEHVTDLLKNALDTGRTTHAYIFSGPRGCGKTTSARIMARCLNCAEGPTSTPCGKCDSCVELATGGTGSLDVVEIDAASNRGVEDARDLRERATFAPTRDRYKIFILDEAHMVTKEGFNALLKLVEEPPEHVKFIFATTEPEKVIGTIRSRTHHYPFRLVAPNVLEPYLRQVAEDENIPVEDGVMPLVVQAGGGSVRDSLSLLDQLIAGSDDAGITQQRALDLLGYTDGALLDSIMDGLGRGDGAAVFQTVAEVTDAGQDPRRFVEDLLQRVRDVLVCALAPGQAAEILPHVPADQLERMRTQADQWGTRLLSRRADLIDEALREMVGATSPRLQLELLMGRLLVAADAGAAPTPAAEPAPAPRPAPAAKAAPKVEPPAQSAAPAPAAKAAPAALEDVVRQWSDVKLAAAELSRATGAYVAQTEPSAVVGNTIHFAIRGALAGRLVPGSSHFSNMQTAVRQVFGEQWDATPTDGAPKNEQPAPTAAPPTERPTRAADSGWGPVAIPGGNTEPPTAPPRAAEPAAPIPEPPADDIEPPEDDGMWAQGVSPDDETMDAPPNSGLAAVLEVLGGTVVDGGTN